MRTQFQKLLAVSLVAFALLCLPNQVSAQSTNKAAAEKKSGKEVAAKKPSSHPIRGTLTAIDDSAKTVTVGKRTYQTTPETKIMKADKPATLKDGVIGDEIGGFVKPTEDGKLVLSSLRFGPKPD